MKEEKKKPESENKIAPFDIDEDLLEDEAIDRLLKESLMKEADELEAELNENPMLREADVADSMFRSIVRQLKEQGLWEEEEADKEQEEDKEPEGNRERKEDTEQKENRDQEGNKEWKENEESEGNRERKESKKREKSGAEEVRKQQPPDIQKEKVLEESAGRLPRTTFGELLKKSVGKSEGAETAEALRETGKRTELRTEESPEKPEKRMEGKAVEEILEAAGKESGAKAEEPIKESAEKVAETETDETLEKSKKQLQTDAGREMQKKRRKRKKRILRHSGIVAAVLAAAFCGSMTSEANRRLVLKVWDGVMYNLGFRVETDYTDSGEIIRSNENEGWKAMQEIQKEIGIPGIDFGYFPDGMKYLNYEIIADALEAKVFYEYQGRIFNVVMINADAEGVMYYSVDGDTEECDRVVNVQGIEGKIWKINSDEEETYVAELVVNECRYILNGKLPLEELKKIVENAFIL